jgi:hypothetical protein
MIRRNLLLARAAGAGLAAAFVLRAPAADHAPTTVDRRRRWRWGHGLPQLATSQYGGPAREKATVRPSPSSNGEQMAFADARRMGACLCPRLP